MDARTIIGLVSAGAQLAGQILALVEASRAALSASDRAALEAALAELQASNDQTHARLQGILHEAAQSG